jgi:hypothetical protein
MSSASATELIDPDGDLTLIVGSDENTKRFRVSRHALRLASPVFKAMLTGRFLEASASELKLPDHDPEALAILLNVSHLQFRKAPPSFQTINGFVGVAKLCDKYDMAAVTRLHINKWMEGSAPFSEKTAWAWTWIAWSLAVRRRLPEGSWCHASR